MPVLSEKRSEKKRSTPTGCLLAVLLVIGVPILALAGTAGFGVWRIPLSGYLFSAGNDSRFRDFGRRAEIEGLLLDNRAPDYESRTVNLGPFWWAWEWPHGRAH